MVEVWYTPHDIHFTRDQVYWLIANLDSLLEGKYPRESTNYTNFGSSINRSTHCPFVSAAELAAEITWRIQRCGLSGKLLISQINNEIPMAYLDYDAKRALNYCSGWRRRKQTFVEWKKDRKYKEKGRFFSLSGQTS